MNSSEAEKAAIISEIEENLAASNNSSQKFKAIGQEDIQQLYADRDNTISQEAIQYAIIHGVDPCHIRSYFPSFEEVKSNFSSDESDSSLDQHYDFFLSTLESTFLIDLVYTNEDDIESFTAKERLLNLKLPKLSFEPLLSSIIDKNPSLHQSLVQLQIISGMQKNKKKIPRKDKKRDKREKDLKDKEIKSVASSNATNGSKSKSSKRDKNEVMNESSLLEPSNYGEVLSLIIAKTIAENSMNNYLLTIALLLVINKDDNFNNLESSNVPVASLIASLFEPVATDESEFSQKSNQSPSNSNNFDLNSKTTNTNPFRNYLETSRSVRSKSISYSDLSRYEIGSIDENKDETFSQSGYNYHGGYSDAGSTICSNLAELGTESVSIMGDELNEDELLAQALALSMVENVPAAKISKVSATPATEKSNLNDTIEAERVDNIRANDANLNSSFGVGSEFRNKSLQHVNLPLPLVDPLSTFGPFCCKDFWSRLCSNNLPDQENKFNNSLPIRHIIVSLLTVISSSITDTLNKDIVSTINPCSFASEQVPLGETKDCDKDPTNKHFVSTVIPITPSVVVFELIDFLLDFLTKEIIAHCSNTKYRPTLFDKTVEDNENDSDDVNSEITDTEWYFHFYFLIWSISTIIRTLKAYLIISARNGVHIGSGDIKSFTEFSSLPFNKLMTSIIEKLSDCADIDCSIIETRNSSVNTAISSFINGALCEKDNLDFSHSASNSILVDIENVPKVSFSYSGISLRHNLRIIASEALINSFSQFQPDPLKRLNFLQDILKKSPTSVYLAKAEIKSMNSYEYMKNLVDNNRPVEEFPNQIYQLWYTQKACVNILCNDEHLNFLDFITKINFPVTHQPVALQSLSDKKSKRRIQIMKFFNSKSYLETNSKIVSIRDILIDRLVESGSNAKDDFYYWGEIFLLQGIQLSIIEQYSAAAVELAAQTNSVSLFPVSLNYNRCHPNLLLSADGKVVTHQGPKLWATVAAQKGFEPNSGNYEWIVKVDKCSKGHVFLGIVTGDSSTDKDSYVGVDRGGWGLIGTRSLWHNKSKVVADYGSGFGTGAVIKVCLDTDKGTLSFQTQESDWGVAFENIPKQVIYPAFSLHEKDDQISFLFCSKVENKNTAKDNTNNKMQDKLPQTIIDSVEHSFHNYSQKILFAADRLLVNFANLSSPIDCSQISHPLIGSFVASLSAFIGSLNYNPTFLRKATFQLLPLLTIVTKRLSSLCERIVSDNLSHSTIGWNNYSVKGKWLIRSSSNGLSFTVNEYLINFSDFANLQSVNTTEADEQRSSLQAIKLYGNGKNLTSDVIVEGTQFGYKVKLLEICDKSENSIMDFRMSLCGKFLSGRSKNIKTGKMGFVDCVRISSIDDNVSLCSILTFMKTSLLCTNACGKLTMNLIIGNPSFSVPSARGRDQNKVATEDPADESLPIIDEPGGNDEVTKEAPIEKEHSEENSINQWMKSNLFSGGLNLNDFYENSLTDNVFQYLHSKNSSDILTDSLIETTIEKITAWWLKIIFPSIKSKIDNQFESKNNIMKVKSGLVIENLNVKLNTYPDFYEQLMNAKGDAQILDDYLSLHSGQSSLVKVGGGSMQKARKMVLVALIKHSGCSKLCVSEVEAIVSGKRQTTDRPNNILLEIWRSVHRVLERMIRIKQESGSSYEDVCSVLFLKAELLMDIQENKVCLAISDSLLFIEEDSGSKEWWLSDAGLDLQQDCLKLLSEIVEFLISPIQNVDAVRNQLLSCAISTAYRIAGFNSFSLLIKNVDTSLYKFPAISPTLFTTIVENVFQSMKELNVINTNNYFEVLNNLSLSGAGHYLDGIFGVSNQLVTQLQISFESIYEPITQHLSRCTWGGDRDGQLVSLMAWGSLIKPEDHNFLNRIGIFRVLQTVLDDARNSINKYSNRIQIDFNSKQNEAGGIDIHIYDKFRDHENGMFAYELILNSHRRLAQLALSIVHGLAWQVACSKEPEYPVSKTSASRLRKTQSGPDTLSKSLFDLMYVELFTATKKLIILANQYLEGLDDTSSKSTSKEASDDISQELLDGENYMYRILRLLFLVSTSKSCQLLLCTPKWLSILFAGITLSGLGIQRRILRLLRRLLIHCDPSNISVYIPSLYGLREEILDTDSPLEDEDIALLINEQEQIDFNSTKNQSIQSSHRLVYFFMEAISVTYPSITTTKETRNVKVLKYLKRKGTLESLSADSLVVLRVLLGIPLWRKQILSCMENVLDLSKKSLFSIDHDSCLEELMMTSSLAVLGGNIEHLRIGGLVSLKPLCLMGSVDNFATKLAAAFHTCGMLVSQSNATSSIEVVLIERGIKVIQPEKSDKKYILSKNNITIHHTTTLTPTLPIRAIRLNNNEIFPCADITSVPSLLNNDILNSIASIVEKISIPWVKSSIDIRGDPIDSVPGPEDKKTNLDMVKTILSVFALKSLSMASQQDENVEYLVSRINLFKDILAVSIENTTIGNLSILECLEDRFSKLWKLLISPPDNQSDDDDNHPGMDRKPSKSENLDIQSEESTTRPVIREMNPSASLRELAAMLSPFGTSRQVDPDTQAAALAQMLEMGLPKEWCEFALKRCNYNVEMAINMCLEHGSDMAQLIAEDSILSSNQSARESSAARRHFIRDLASQDNRPLQRETTRRVSGGLVDSSTGVSSSLPSRSSSSIDSHSLIRQLLDMGFPPSWCARAMASTNNDFDAALGWILTHDGDPNSAEETSKSKVTPDDDKPIEESLDTSSSMDNTSSELVHNPLVVISGNCEIKDNLTCSTPVTGFPSVGCRGFAATSGKWYYELTVITAGCVQVGWVDCAFEGGADSGQGVGDDLHSWAFDGWRTYIWHESSAEWGTKWAPGDVIGCALDMDEKSLSFYLNGFGVEVSMGEAFTDFISFGGLYPCVSFNRNEKIQFNFGSTPFKYGPPPGYSGFIDHVLSLHKNVAYMIDSFGLDSKFTSTLTDDNDKKIEPLLENSFEECHDQQYYSWMRRYFQHDEAKNLQADTLNHFIPSKIEKIPNNRKDQYKQFLIIATDLSIIYARLSTLRSLNHLANFKNDSKSSSSINLFNSLIKEDETSDRNYLLVKNLFQLIRLTSAYSNRTKSHLLISSILPPSFQVPNNLGSIFSTGGYPVLCSLKDSFLAMIKEQSNNSRLVFNLIDQMIKEVFHHLLVSIRREYSTSWRIEGKFCPYVFQDGIVSDKDVEKSPSIAIAFWLTSMMLGTFVSMLTPSSTSSSGNENKNNLLLSENEINGYIQSILRAWETSLRSPSMAVKMCSMRVITYILQEFISPNFDISEELHDMIKTVISKNCIRRYEQLALSRIAGERNALPVCSEYLQTVLEFSVTASGIHNTIKYDDSSVSTKPELDNKPQDNTDTEIPFMETKNDFYDPNFNWEAVSGRVFTDDEGWKTWSGTIKILKSSNLPSSYNRLKISERQDLPPELMPGCKVMKKILKKKEINNNNNNNNTVSTKLSSDSNALDTKSSDDNDISDISSPTSAINSATSAIESIARLKRLFEQSKDDKIEEDGALPEDEIEDFIENIGTVVSIQQWPNSSPGSAREILWLDGTTEIVRWGAENGVYDVTHVVVEKDKIVSKYPHPTPKLVKILNGNFGSEKTFGIILRVRSIENESGNEQVDSNSKPLKAIIEWPDFNSLVIADGHINKDGTWSLTEKELLSGPNHSGWDSIFGTSHWQKGTKFTLNISSDYEITDAKNVELSGEYSNNLKIVGMDVDVKGEVRLQKNNLFYFDSKMHAANISLSTDKLSVSKIGGGGQGCAFGTVGFSSGVHFWEFKIEQAEIGSIFVGVSEKPDNRSGRLSRWMGSGFVNSRTSFQTSPQIMSERVGVYGDHFHTGDIVGVMLDMNRGRLSFFLDGMKYGEHTIAELGEAFDNLTSSESVKPKTYFPIVGLSKSMDRVTLTPRWLSSVGSHPREEYDLYKKAWLLLSSWSIERQSNRPFENHLWIYRYGWRNWLKWKTGKYMRIRTRCKVTSMPVIIDITPLACVQASIRLGLEYALFSGDHIVFSKSSGRSLDIKEEAIILGAFNGFLWYRLDAQQNNNNGLMESGSLARCLLPNDTEGMKLIRRKPFENSKLNQDIISIPLPRIPTFSGGLINLFHESGAVVRDGLEIDTADILCTIPSNTIIYAVERRMNASNINRYKVLYEGNYGWISEKMRGGAEEVMLSKLTDASAEKVNEALSDLMERANDANITDRIKWTECENLTEAVNCWRDSVREVGSGHLLLPGGLLSETPLDYVDTGKANSFDDYVLLASTIDGKNQWTTEADMQLVEHISKCASKVGLSPHNLSASALKDSLKDIEVVDSSLLKNIDCDRIIARAALLRVANQVFGYVLSHINLHLPEEKLKIDVFGSDSEIDFIKNNINEKEMKIQSSVKEVFGLEKMQSNNVQEIIKTDNLTNWIVPCCARRLRSMRRLLFSQTKSSFFDSILEATTTITPLHQDEYEDPKEIKTIRINRVKASQSRLAAISNSTERLKLSVFGQLHKELRSWPNSAFRRSYVGKGHGGQKRAFKVKFIGEGVNDYGGPYRAVFEQVIDEVHCDTVTTGGRKPSDKCLLPLLVPCGNRTTLVGSNQDKYVLSTSPVNSTLNQELMQFFGKTVGTAVRENMNLGLNLSSMFWRPLVKLPISIAHLETVDTLIVNNIKEVIKTGLELEKRRDSGDAEITDTYRPEEWQDMTFVTHLPDGTRCPLVIGGGEMAVNLNNWREYVRLLEQCHLQESAAMYKVFKDGLSAVLPVELFPLFTANEFECLIAGSSHVDINLIQQCTEYEDISPTSKTVQYFWEVLHEMDNEEKTLFLRFVWARSRMPMSTQELSMNFKLQGAQGAAKETPDKYLPSAQTCFFSLSLPPYTSKEILREKLIYAIKNSPNMDADVRLHSAEGWADS